MAQPLNRRLELHGGLEGLHLQNAGYDCFGRAMQAQEDIHHQEPH